ncbi:MAG: sugar nucleotide-binding protein [Thermincolia bacterium]
MTEPAYGTLFNQAGIEGVKVKPITTGEINRPAPRPAYSVMDNYIWRLQGKQPLRNYKEALVDYLKSVAREENK